MHNFRCISSQARPWWSSGSQYGRDRSVVDTFVYPDSLSGAGMSFSRFIPKSATSDELGYLFAADLTFDSISQYLKTLPTAGVCPFILPAASLS